MFRVLNLTLNLKELVQCRLGLSVCVYLPCVRTSSLNRLHELFTFNTLEPIGNRRLIVHL